MPTLALPFLQTELAFPTWEVTIFTGGSLTLSQALIQTIQALTQ